MLNTSTDTLIHLFVVHLLWIGLFSSPNKETGSQLGCCGPRGSTVSVTPNRLKVFFQTENGRVQKKGLILQKGINVLLHLC